MRPPKGIELGLRLLSEIASIVTPDTVLRWHRRLIAAKWTYASERRKDRPGVMAGITVLRAPFFGGRMVQMDVTFGGFDRITAGPAMLGGKPCIRGVRISVKQVLGILANNPSWDDLRQDYPELEPEDIRQALAFAAANDRSGPAPDAEPAPGS